MSDLRNSLRLLNRYILSCSVSFLSFCLVCLFFFFFFFNDTATTEIYTLSLHDALPILLTSRLSLSKHLAHNLGNLLLLGKIGVFHNRRNASSRLLLLISKHLILCIYLVFRILA